MGRFHRLLAAAGCFAVVLAMNVAPGTTRVAADYTGANATYDFPDHPCGSAGTTVCYDYAPTVLWDGTYQRFWWCADDKNYGGGDGSGDVVMYRQWSSAGGWTAPQEVLHPSASGWDSYETCDPHVIEGTFTYNATSYAFAMYYTGNSSSTFLAASIGVAFSNDGINWVKDTTDNPIIGGVWTNTSGCTSLYGAGESHIVNKTGHADIAMIYFDGNTCWTTHSPFNGEGKVLLYRSSTDGIHFSTYTLVPQVGDNMTPGIGWDTASNTWYLVAANRAPRQIPCTATSCNEVGVAPCGQATCPEHAEYQVGVWSMPGTTFPTGTWTPVGYVDPDVTGFNLNHNANFETNQYGAVNAWLPSLVVFSGAGTSDPGTWNISYSTVRATPNHLNWERYIKSGMTTGGLWDTKGYVGSGYTAQTSLGYVFQTPQPGTVEVFQCLWGGPTGVIHFASTDPNCETSSTQYNYQLGSIGFFYPNNVTPPAGTKAVYRCWSATYSYFDSNSSTCEGNTVEGLLGYALTS